MSVQTTIVTNLVLVCLLAQVRAASVSYTVEFNASWSSQTHPNAYPSNAHFSPLIGAAHNDQVGFWSPGGLASDGIEQMAETGGRTLLQNEIQAAINAGTASSVILGSGVNSPGSTTASFEVSSDHPFLTLVTMVAPSPDWFLGVHGLDLRDTNGWKSQVTVDLFGYDAGTDSGVDFTSANADTNPAETIDLLAAPFAANDPPLGTFTLTLVPEPSTGTIFLLSVALMARCRRRAFPKVQLVTR